MGARFMILFKGIGSVSGISGWIERVREMGKIQDTSKNQPQKKGFGS